MHNLGGTPRARPTAVLLAVELYELHAGSAYLVDAERLIAWAHGRVSTPTIAAVWPTSYLQSRWSSAFKRVRRPTA